MIRSLAADELIWFLTQYYAFLGHSDARSFAQRIAPRIRDQDAEADRAFILVEGKDKPLAGVYVLAPEHDDDNQNLYLSNLWYTGSEKNLESLLRQVFARHKYEAVHFPLFNFSTERIQTITPVFDTLGFTLEGACDLDFELADLPPLGMPLVLEAWSYQTDDAFKDLYCRAESTHISEEYWAWLKRWRGKFNPDYWFMLRETLDQEPVGYAFYGAKQKGIDGIYYLTAAGVLPQYRDSSEMLRRLVISSMHDLASRSPLGRIQTTVHVTDPKLIHIFESLGFYIRNRYQVLVKYPR